MQYVCRREATAASGLSEAQLRSYQQQVIQVARSGANLIVVAPTGSGKTAIVIRHAAVVLGKDPKQRIVFLAPTVALAQQQAGRRQAWNNSVRLHGGSPLPALRDDKAALVVVVRNDCAQVQSVAAWHAAA